MTFTRREMIGMGLAAMEGVLLSACGASHNLEEPQPLLYPKLLAKPKAGVKSTVLSVGLNVPYTDGTADALLYVPAKYNPQTSAPLLLMLAAEGAPASSGVDLFRAQADSSGMLILGVNASGQNWDYFADGERFGADVVFLSNALQATFNICNVDTTKMSVGGFSYGGAYALAVGLSNGDLFSHVMSFSAEYIPPYHPLGKPGFFVSNGTSDTVSTFDFSGRTINTDLKQAGYTVDYVEFDGGHEIPDAILQQAIAWMIA